LEPLSEQKLTGLLRDNTLAVSVYPTVDSTSSECRRRLERGQTRSLVLAEQQSAGRGRQGRDFFSPAARGLYFSLMFPPRGGIASADGFTACAAVCVRRAIAKVCGVSCGIKWVNDLYLDNRKVCGILCEAVGDTVIVGVGINLLSGELPENIADIAGALNSDCDRNLLAAEIVNSLLEWEPGAQDYMEEYRAGSVVLGRRISFTCGGEMCSGIARDICPDGSLAVETGSGTFRLNSGEIRLEKESLFADNR